MPNFNFLEKGLHDFSRKEFLMLFAIKWPNLTVWLLLLLEISGNMFIVIVCFPGCHVINFEIYLSFLIKPFSYRSKKSEQKFSYLNNKKSFLGEIKNIFHHFWKTFTCQKLSQTRGCVFKEIVFNPVSPNTGSWYLI